MPEVTPFPKPEPRPPKPPYQMKRKRLRPMSDKRRAELPEHDRVRAAVFARDCHKCQAKVRGVLTRWRCSGPLTFHHIRKAAQGGRYTEDNGVALCAGHNDILEADADAAAEAEAVGLVVRSHG